MATTIERRLSGTPFYRPISSYGIGDVFFDSKSREIITYFPALDTGLTQAFNLNKKPRRSLIYGEKMSDSGLAVGPLERIERGTVHVYPTDPEEQLDIALRMHDWGVANEMALNFLASQKAQDILKSKKLKIDRNPQGRVYSVEFFK